MSYEKSRCYERMADTRGMERSEWLRLRKQGIGGSDAAAIMGMSPFTTPLMVYWDKISEEVEEEDKEQSVAMRFGRDCEEIVARWFCEETGKRVRRENAILRNLERPWMLANVDRMIIGENAGLECKTTSAFNKTNFEGGNIPSYYYWQCVHYMAVTGADAWYLAVLHGNHAFYHYKIPRQTVMIEQLLAFEETFWHEHIEKGVPPQPSGGDAETEMIAKRAGTETPGLSAYISPALMSDYQLAKKALDTAKASVEAIQNDIRLQLGAAELGTCPGWKITYKSETRRTVDSKRLKAEAPDIYSRYTRESESRVLRLSEA